MTLLSLLLGAATADTPLRPAPGQRAEPSLATDGSDTLVAWTDLGARRATGRGPTEIVAVLLDPSLAPRSPPLRLPQRDPNGRSVVQALSCGSAWLLVISGPGNTLPAPLQVARLAAGPDGLRLDGEPLILAPSTGEAHADCRGETAVITWGEVRGTTFTESRAVRLDLGPGPLVATPLPLPAPPAAQDCAWPPFALLQRGSGWWVGWYRRDPSGKAVLSGAALDPARGASEPVQLWDFGTDWPSGFVAEAREDVILIVATHFDERVSARARLALRVGDQGLLDPAPWVLDPPHPNHTSPVKIASDAEGFLVYWAHPFGMVEGARVPPSGPPVPLTLFRAPGERPWVPHVALTRRGPDLVAAWTEVRDPRGEPVEVRVGRLAPTQRSVDRTVPGPPPNGALEPRVLSLAAPDQFDPAIASRGSEHLVVWTDTGEEPQRIWGRWLDADGRSLGAPFPLADTRSQAPAAVAGDKGYLVAWVGFGEGGRAGLYARYLSPKEGPVGEPVRLSGPGGRPVVAWDRAQNRFLIGGMPDGAKIWTVQQGQPLDPSPLLHIGPQRSTGSMEGPFLGCGPGGCAVALEGAAGGDPWIAGATLTARAEVRELVELPVNHFIGGLAWSGTAQLVRTERQDDRQAALVWSEVVRGRRLQDLASVALPGNCHRPVAAFGDLVFIEARAPFGEGTVLMASRSEQGPQVGPLLQASQIAVAENPAGGLLAAWSAWDPALGAHRLHVALWSAPPGLAGPLDVELCGP